MQQEHHLGTAVSETYKWHVFESADGGEICAVCAFMWCVAVVYVCGTLTELCSREDHTMSTLR